MEDAEEVKLYEPPPTTWQFGRGKPRLGGLSVEATEERRQAHRDESHLRVVETLQRRKADRTSFDDLEVWC